MLNKIKFYLSDYSVEYFVKWLYNKLVYEKGKIKDE